MEPTRIFDLLDRFSNFPDTIGNFKLGKKVSGQWKEYSAKEYLRLSNHVSYGLLTLGCSQGDKIATITNNRPEWNFLSMGISQIGAVHVPIHPILGAEDIVYILNHSGAKLVIVSDDSLFAKISAMKDQLPLVEQIFTFNNVEGARNWTEITLLGESNESFYFGKLNALKSSVLEDDLVALIYTSGTTGGPKGVMLSHRNLLSNAIASANRLHLNHNHRVLSFLPLSHVYEHMVNYMYQYLGISIYYSEAVTSIASDIKELQVDGFITVPRLLESIYEKILIKAKTLSRVKRGIFTWALKLASNYIPFQKQGILYEAQLAVADKLVFSKWREALSKNITFIGCGGAALQPRLARIFWAAKLPVFEGYGLTETSPVLAVNYNQPGKVKVGTVGTIMEGAEIKIAEDGEILARGPFIMKGYYKDPEQTAAVIDQDGWFHTGDIGEFEDGAYLKITDRKKELIKMSNGKYLAPQQIENKLKESFYIQQTMVFGDNQNFASALIIPNFNVLLDWCQKQKIRLCHPSELVKMPQVIKIFEDEIRNYNRNFQSFEQVKKIILISDEWSPLTGELSPTLKLKRKQIIQKYKNLVDAVYDPEKAI
jgi:long-chain acyl-CoA synthetase